MSLEREQVAQELRRITDGGSFDESFWQALYEPTRRLMRAAREERDSEPKKLQRIADAMARDAVTVDDYRAARKAAEKARKAFGMLRARNMNFFLDRLSIEWNQSVKWISDARDAAVLIDRSNKG